MNAPVDACAVNRRPDEKDCAERRTPTIRKWNRTASFHIRASRVWTFPQFIVAILGPAVAIGRIGLGRQSGICVERTTSLCRRPIASFVQSEQCRYGHQGNGAMQARLRPTRRVDRAARPSFELP